ncbi:MAG: hypothetical protein J2P46_10995 [Zavarzinella sp.]|nr:hypothetical protein [Zavarzinella sp.]
MAIFLGLGLFNLARLLFYRASPPVTWRERSDWVAYWFGRVVGAVILVLGVIAVILELVLLILK